MLQPNQRDVSILTQVVFKDFCNTKKTLPKSQENWDNIKQTTQDLFKTIGENYVELQKVYQEQPKQVCCDKYPHCSCPQPVTTPPKPTK